MSDFDLRRLVNDLAAAEGEWTLDDLVDRVYSSTPAKERAAAYRQALHEYVRIRLGNLRAPDPQPDLSVRGAQNNPVGLGPNIGRSRAALARAGFRMQVHCGPGAWKAIELCTSAELLYAAAECDRMAEFNARRGEQYRALVKVMDQHGADIAGDLPTEIVEQVFTDDDH